MTANEPMQVSRKAGPRVRPLLLLASSSPRRRSLMAERGYKFEVVRPAGVREIAPAHLSPGETVLANAIAKARAVSRLRPDALVVGVDTEVFFRGQVFGKPASMEAALEMLMQLNGQVHEVFSGVWFSAANRGRGFVEVSRVHFRRRSSAELRRYLERIGPLDKAGAYAAQNDNGEMIARVEGSYSNVVGLPMERLAEELRREGIVP